MPLPGVTVAIGRSPTRATPQFAKRAIATGVQTQPSHPVVGTRKTTTVALMITIMHATLAETKSRAQRENIMKLKMKKTAVVLSDFERGILERFVASHQEEHGRYLEAVSVLANDRAKVRAIGRDASEAAHVSALADDDCPSEPQITQCETCGYDVDGGDPAYACVCRWDEIDFAAAGI